MFTRGKFGIEYTRSERDSSHNNRPKKRKALFVGICDYGESGLASLPWTANDALELSRFFEKQLGYETQLLIDTTVDKLKRVLEDCTRDLIEGDLFLFYFAGHGNESNLACFKGRRFPLAELKKLIDRDFDTVVISDSCRTNDDVPHGARDLKFVSSAKSTTWLNSVFSANGNGARAIIYACEEGRSASDDGEHGHGLFTQAFLTELRALRWRRGKVCVDGHLGDSIGLRMEKLLNFRQRPHVENIGHVPVLMEGKGILLKSVFSIAAVLTIAVAAWMWSDYPDYGDPARYPPQERYERGESFHKRWLFREGNRKCALKWIESAAKDGCADAQFAMGNIWEDGELGVCKNEIEALEWYKRAAAQNHVMALASLGDFYRMGKGGLKIDHKKAFSYLYAAATNGVSKMQKLVGDCYCTGDLVGETNVVEAVKFYNLAAAQGNSDALFALYAIYKSGAAGVSSNQQVAVSYLLRSEDAGNLRATVALGVCYAKGEMGFAINKSKALDLFRKAAEQGSAYAQYSLGWCYCNGQGVEQNFAEAVKWHRKAAEQGDANAQCYLGSYYYKGQGVEQNFAEAVKWYRMSAEQGNAYAQSRLGWCYYYGQGVEQNFAEAVKWYRKAAEQGNAYAQYDLGQCYANGDGVAKDEAEAVKWYRKAAEQGHFRSQFYLGTMYESGRGVPKDYQMAVKWYKASAKQGDEDVQKALNRFKSEN